MAKREVTLYREIIQYGKYTSVITVSQLIEDKPEPNGGYYGRPLIVDSSAEILDATPLGIVEPEVVE